jgi:hypothetical protein
METATAAASSHYLRLFAVLWRTAGRRAALLVPLDFENKPAFGTAGHMYNPNLKR